VEYWSSTQSVGREMSRPKHHLRRVSVGKAWLLRD
jgi:hypothetical protein